MAEVTELERFVSVALLLLRAGLPVVFVALFALLQGRLLLGVVEVSEKSLAITSNTSE